jgi:hypothetical protein
MPVIDATRLDTRLDGVEQRLEALERRLLALEGRAGAVDSPAPLEAPPAAVQGLASLDAVALFTLAGRTFVILAGAYLLRALTESAVVPGTIGLALGLAYACAWSVAADRAAPHSPMGATFYGACTVLVGMPLLWEAVTRFALIGPAVSASILGGVTALVLGTAWHRRLQTLAWIATLGSIAAGIALLVTTGAIVAFAVFFIALGVATLWLGYHRDWVGPRWPAALAVDAIVLGLAGRALTTPPRDAPAVVLAVQVVLLVAYLGSIAARTLVRGRDVVPFEIAQTIVMLAAGLGGAIYVADATGVAQRGLGLALLAIAGILYAVAFAFVDRRQGRRLNFYFYTSLALVMVLTGSELLMKGAALGLVWAGLAILTAAGARRYRRFALSIHAEIYMAAAAIATGLIAVTLGALFGPADVIARSVNPAGWSVLAALGFVLPLSTRSSGDEAARPSSIAAAALAALTAVILGGTCAVVSIGLLQRLAIPTAAGVVATVRTGVVAAAAVVVAWLGRRDGTRAFGYLLYPVLAWGAVKLVIEDLPAASPALLFIALGLYGAALILGPRLARRS